MESTLSHATKAIYCSNNQYSLVPSFRALTTKPKHCVRSYIFKVDERCNALKLAKLSAMHAEWQRLLPVVGEHLWSKFLDGDRLDKSLSSRVGVTSIFGDSPLVTSVKQCLAVAVEGQIKSWKSNLQLRITRLVMRSSRYAANPELRHQILWLNAMQLWLVPRDQRLVLLATAQGKTKVSSVDARCSRLTPTQQLARWR